MTNDEKGKDIFYQWAIQQQCRHILFTREKYNPIDAYIYDIEDDKYSVEIKYRNHPSSTYDSDMLEKTKYNSLISTLEEKDCRNCLYFNIFSDNVIFIYRLRDMKPNWVKRNLPTDEDKTIYKNKLVTYLPHWRAQRYKF